MSKKKKKSGPLLKSIRDGDFSTLRRDIDFSIPENLKTKVLEEFSIIDDFYQTCLRGLLQWYLVSYHVSSLLYNLTINPSMCGHGREIIVIFTGNETCTGVIDCLSGHGREHGSAR